MYNLFLDDERYPHQVKWVELPLVEWKIVRSYTEFVNHIKQHGLPARVTFDHDLAFEHYPVFEADGGIHSPTTIPYDKYSEKTGYHCALWLAEYCQEKALPYPEAYIHTMNRVGKENIRSVIQPYQKIYNEHRLSNPEQHPTER